MTLHGLKVGQVTDVRLGYDPAKEAIAAPVRFEVQPERIVGVGRQVVKDVDVGVDQLVERGMRATLESASLLTGQMQDRPRFPARCAAGKDDEGRTGHSSLPTSDSGSFSGLQASATESARQGQYDSVRHARPQLKQDR